MKNNKILFIEICNYSDFPIGGYLSFAKQMIKEFGNQLALVGLTTDKNTPIGVWSKKKIDDVIFDFFAVQKVKKDSSKGIIPSRLITYFAVKKYRNQIFSYNTKNIFIQTPEVLLAMNINFQKNLCSRIPGLENPLTISRYSYSKYFAKMFEKLYFNYLKKAQIIFATGDNIAIDDYLKRSEGILSPEKIIKFPSRINTNIFLPKDKEKIRNDISWDLSKTYIITSGRLSKLKGWQFMLDCFIEFKNLKPNSHFIFIGDGEDKERIKNYISAKGIDLDVTLKGRVNHSELSNYLNAADIYIMGSYVEGWSTALVEAISCAKPIVCTDFSSANELIDEGYNGFVIKNRQQNEFVKGMINSLSLSKKNLLKKAKEMDEFSTNHLKKDILKYWKLV